MSTADLVYQRAEVALLRKRLREPRRFVQVVAGPRQVGKSTLAAQATRALDRPVHFVSADEPTLRGAGWIAQQWETARQLAAGAGGAVLVLDEAQKIPDWSEVVKRLWDEDTLAKRPLRVVLLGSAPQLIAQGLSESLAGRFESITLTHWTYAEMREAFGWDINTFVYHGGYPGAATLVSEPERWRRYLRDSLIETSISRDVLLMARVHKPALLRRVFDFSCHYSGQVLSYTKMLGQLHDAGNTTTLAHYLELLAGAGMARGLPKYAGDRARARASSPKLQVFNTGLMTATGDLTYDEARADREYWGRLVESAVGAHLVNAELRGDCTVHYWREGNAEVDFVIRRGRRVTAIEVKSSRAPQAHTGIEAFTQAFRPHRTLLVGGNGIAVERFLLEPVTTWFKD